MINFFLKKETGQILVETMVALSMVVIGLLGLLSLLTYSIGLNKVISDQYVASYLAAEGIEIIKYLIDSNVANGDSYNSGLLTGDYEVDASGQISPNQNRFIYFDNQQKVYTYSQGTDSIQTPFKRKINISYNGGNEMIVKSTVSWQGRGGSFQEITVEDHFFNWRQ
jgi:Tfp pilus assembly protein PilV